MRTEKCYYANYSAERRKTMTSHLPSNEKAVGKYTAETIPTNATEQSSASYLPHAFRPTYRAWQKARITNWKRWPTTWHLDTGGLQARKLNIIDVWQIWGRDRFLLPFTYGDCWHQPNQQKHCEPDWIKKPRNGWEDPNQVTTSWNNRWTVSLRGTSMTIMINYVIPCGTWTFYFVIRTLNPIDAMWAHVLISLHNFASVCFLASNC